jgi:hypothetical protein
VRDEFRKLCLDLHPEMFGRKQQPKDSPFQFKHYMLAFRWVCLGGGGRGAVTIRRGRMRKIIAITSR